MVITESKLKEIISTCIISEIKKAKKKSGLEKFLEKHGIKIVSCNGAAIGFSEKEQKWYGWSHRAIYGFGIGDIPIECYPGKTVKGKKIKTLDQAKEAAIKFSKSVS